MRSLSERRGRRSDVGEGLMHIMTRWTIGGIWREAPLGTGKRRPFRRDASPWLRHDLRRRGRHYASKSPRRIRSETAMGSSSSSMARFISELRPRGPPVIHVQPLASHRFTQVPHPRHCLRSRRVKGYSSNWNWARQINSLWPLSESTPEPVSASGEPFGKYETSVWNLAL